MSDAKIEEYIRLARTQGVSEEIIKSNLSSVGWSKTKIEEAIRESTLPPQLGKVVLSPHNQLTPWMPAILFTVVGLSTAVGLWYFMRPIPKPVPPDVRVETTDETTEDMSDAKTKTESSDLSEMLPGLTDPSGMACEGLLTEATLAEILKQPFRANGPALKTNLSGDSASMVGLDPDTSLTVECVQAFSGADHETVVSINFATSVSTLAGDEFTSEGDSEDGFGAMQKLTIGKGGGFMNAGFTLPSDATPEVREIFAQQPSVNHIFVITSDHSLFHILYSSGPGKPLLLEQGEALARIAFDRLDEQYK